MSEICKLEFDLIYLMEKKDKNEDDYITVETMISELEIKMEFLIERLRSRLGNLDDEEI
jgi:hypothetical protein